MTLMNAPIATVVGPKPVAHANMYADFDAAFNEMYQACQPYTMTSPERLYAVHQAIQHVTRAGVIGDFVECGVWKGGSAMMAALSLQRLRQSRRSLYLYDTYEGMTEPTQRDVDYRRMSASERFQAERLKNPAGWCVAA